MSRLAQMFGRISHVQAAVKHQNPTCLSSWNNTVSENNKVFKINHAP